MFGLIYYAGQHLINIVSIDVIIITTGVCTAGHVGSKIKVLFKLSWEISENPSPLIPWIILSNAGEYKRCAVWFISEDKLNIIV